MKVNEDGSDRLTHNVQRGRKGTQNGIGRILGYQGLFLCRLPRDHFMVVQLLGCARGITIVTRLSILYYRFRVVSLFLYL